MTARFLLSRVSGFVPLLMSVASLGVVAFAVAAGVTPQPDEGALARIWQLLIAGQVPIVGWFVVRWLPLAPRPAGAVLAAQVAAGLIAVSPVFLLHL